MPDQFELFAEPKETEQIDSEISLKTTNKHRILFFDLETKKSANDVGGWEYVHLMELAVGVVWDSLERKFFCYLESEASQLVEKLKTANLVVGFNVVKFDYGVLQPYAEFDLHEITTFDMLIDIKKLLGHRLSLDHLAQNTLAIKKSADGLASLEWYKEGEIDKIVEYCKQDVEITRDLFLYGESHGYVKYKTRSGNVEKCNVNWEITNLI